MSFVLMVSPGLAFSEASWTLTDEDGAAMGRLNIDFDAIDHPASDRHDILIVSQNGIGEAFLRMYLTRSHKAPLQTQPGWFVVYPPLMPSCDAGPRFDHQGKAADAWGDVVAVFDDAGNVTLELEHCNGDLHRTVTGTLYPQ